MSEKRLKVFSRIIFAGLLVLALTNVVRAQHGGGSRQTGAAGSGASSTGRGSNPGADRDGTTGETPSGRPDRGHRGGTGDASDSAQAAQRNSDHADTEMRRHPDIAARLNATPDALRSQYQTALASNPNLTFGQFIAANVIANNLSASHPGITTDAILNGLAGGKSLGETLQGLGLSAQEAREAEREARRAAKHKS